MRKRFLLILLLLIWISSLAKAQNTRQISGIVQDAESNEKIAGVAVVLKGTANGTVTDSEGKFSMTVPEGNEAVLLFSFLGYLTESIPVGTLTEINVNLKIDQNELNEIVIIGYGQVNKKELTGAVVSIKSEDIIKLPSTNVLEGLQGKLAGVDITRSSGEAGSGINIAVRGTRSITAGNEPLYIVDGIQYGNIQDLNPNDIESMTVLKDASTTAIYGSRGANGVIIITTKSGNSDKTRVFVNSYIGFTNVQYPKVNDNWGYIGIKREANLTTGRWLSEADDSKIFSTFELAQIQDNASFDWQDKFLKDGTQQDYQIGVSGGSAKTRFYLSFDYFREDGLFRMENFSRYSARINLDHSITQKIKIGTQTQITYNDRNRRSNPLTNANKNNPLWDPYDDNGNLIYLIDGRFANPMFDELPENYKNNERATRIFSTLFLDVQLLPSLNFRSNLSMILGNRRNGIYRALQTVDRFGTSSSEAIYGTENSLNFTWENILTYQKVFGNHSLTATGITTLLLGERENQSASGLGQLLNYQLYFGLANTTPGTPSSQYLENNLASFTGRVQYAYKGKYILTLTGRSDGASPLSEGNKWDFFPSAAAAWQIVDEPFMQNNKVFSELKLRASYGLAGNSSVEPYSSEDVLQRIIYSFDETAAPGFRFNPRIGNSNLRWEKSTTANLGLDFAILNNRISGSIDVYDTKTKDLLLQRTLPATSGVGSIVENIGKTRNRGIEVSLSGLVLKKGDFTWNAGINWFTNKEEIVELATGANDLVNGWFIGHPVVSYFDYEKIGIWQSDETDAAASYGQAPGDIKVKDQNGDGVIDPNNDRIILGNNRPKWTANLTSDLSFKGFDFSVQFYTRYGQMMQYQYMTIFDPQGIENGSVQNYWTPENPSNDFPRPNANKSRTATLYFNTLQYKDASFFKLRGITLGYSLPASAIKSLGLSRARVYITGRNVFTLTEVKDYDPERGGSMANPIPRMWVGGINLEF